MQTYLILVREWGNSAAKESGKLREDDATDRTKKSLFVLSVCFTSAYSHLEQLARKDSVSGGRRLESLTGTVKSTNGLQAT